ncbi:DUF6350 family protein [Corynebacterium sp. P7202]|uniref:DUF6350 family protein n=1 Tax=Corynebacterium pygosceleis TaxID=2800406 RepID=A0A9Q4CBB4_9CORY|nr:DUF6350 family protein [Corynebacterium pygosceleis]MCK7638139.1 DUF6350 family protein [Corynebacterium pygosceleis]MCX7444306.1 DUF6350 family protein [Corynebacterium pygosceleis]MCX7468855.1 DUF6350 family protein [Corynebacterium pygosceleis]
MRDNLRRRLRAFLPVALIPNAVVVAVVVLVALCALMLTDSGFVPLAATVAQLWLAVNLAPVASDTAVLSQLPMLPALGVVWLVSHRVRVAVRHRISILDLTVLTGCVLLTPVVLALTATAMLLDARPVLPVEVPPLAVVLGRVLLLHLGALVIGMGPKLWRALARRFTVPPSVVDAVAPAVRFLLALAVAGLLLVLVSLVVHWRVLAELLDTFGGGTATAGLVGVSLLYLPDAAVAGAAVLVGSEFHLGGASVSLHDVTVVPLPPLPLLAAVPTSVPGWALVLIVIPPVLAGIVAHGYCRAGTRTWREMGLAGLWAGVFTVIVGALTGGTVGVYGSSGVAVILTAALVAVELAVVGAVVNTVTGILLQRRSVDGDTEPPTDAVDDGEMDDGAGPGVDGEGSDVDGTVTGEGSPGETVDEEDLIAAGESDAPGPDSVDGPADGDADTAAVLAATGDESGHSVPESAADAEERGGDPVETGGTPAPEDPDEAVATGTPADPDEPETQGPERDARDASVETGTDPETGDRDPGQ